jgi:DNA-binding transcriptional LysR family regulator
MHFAHRIRTLWSWLPSFRAVGETEHLPTAAAELGVVPSSLSRMVKQLEDELGISLFDRTGKQLVLNPAGRTLLVAVREAMRIVDDAIELAVGDELRGNASAIASSELVQAILIPACGVLATTAPRLTTTLLTGRDDIPGMLLRGEVDAAVIAQAGPLDPDLRATELATWTRGVYGRRARSASEPARCVVVGSPSDPLDDGWPAGRERQIVAWAPDEHAALELCAHDDLVTVAFDAVARSCRQPERWVRLRSPEIPSRALYLVSRRAVGRHRRTDALVDAIKHASEAVSSLPHAQHVVADEIP